MAYIQLLFVYILYFSIYLFLNVPFLHTQSRSSFSLNHHHIEYSQSIHTIQIHTYSLNTLHTTSIIPSNYVHIHIHPYPHQDVPKFSLWHTHHLDIVHHTLPLLRYTYALTHLHTIQICSHLNASHLNTPLRPHTHILPRNTHTFFYTYNTDTSTLSNIYITQIPPTVLHHPDTPILTYSTNIHILTHILTQPHPISYSYHPIQISWCSHSTSQTHHSRTSTLTFSSPNIGFPAIRKYSIPM